MTQTKLKSKIIKIGRCFLHVEILEKIKNFLEETRYASVDQVAIGCKLNWRTAKKYCEYLAGHDKGIKTTVVGRVTVYIFSSLEHRVMKIEEEMVYIEYFDHCTLKGNPGKILPPVCACLGMITEETEQYLIIKTLWSKTLNQFLERQVILKSNIKERKKVKFE